LHNQLKKKISKQEEKNSTKDEFDYATDWRRTYVQVYTRLKWLNAYAQLNYIAF
jgi:hypothetical protein